MNIQKVTAARLKSIAQVIADVAAISPVGKEEMYGAVIESAKKRSWVKPSAKDVDFPTARANKNEDATQEGWVALLEAESLKGNALSVEEAATACVDHLNRVKLTERKYQDSEIPMVQGFDAPAPDESEGYSSRKAAMAAVFNALDIKSRNVMWLRLNLDGHVDDEGHDLPGLSQEETAERLGLTRQNVRTIENKAMQFLKEKMSDA